MALLAPGPQIQLVAILRGMIEVRYGEHHMRSGFRMGAVIFGTAPLATRMFYYYSTGTDDHTGAAQYTVSDHVPVSRIPGFIFRFYRHYPPHAVHGPVGTP